MTTRSHFLSHSLAALAVAAGLASATSARAVNSPVEPPPPVTIYKQLGFAFGFTNSTPGNLLGGFGGGGGGGGFGGGGFVPPLNLAPVGGNFLAPPVGGGGGGGGGLTLISPPILQGGARSVQTSETPPTTFSTGQTTTAPVPDTGVGLLGFGFVLAGMVSFARRFIRPARKN